VIARAWTVGITVLALALLPTGGRASGDGDSGGGGCGNSSCPSGQTPCGDGCMPQGASCCPNGTSNCPAPFVCNADNLCVAGGGVGDCHALGALCCYYGCPTTKCCPANAPYGCSDNLGTWDCFATQQDADYEVTNGVCRSSIGGGGSTFLCN
jgi:hypothetical protein